MTGPASSLVSACGPLCWRGPWFYEDGPILIFIGFGIAILLGGIVGGWLTRDKDLPISRHDKRRKYLLWWLTRRDRVRGEDN